MENPMQQLPLEPQRTEEQDILSEDDLMLAIGWLAKENKIGLHDINGDTQVSLEVNVYI